MWVIFRDPKNPFTHLDKYVVEILAGDDDILRFQAHLLQKVGGTAHVINPDVYFLQPLLTSSKDVDYFARRYKPWPTSSPSP
jgi:hypothetical protein